MFRSLQLKVTKLQEERERSLPKENGGNGPDLKDEEGIKDGKSPGSTPGNVPGERISDGDSGRSCKESNSTDPKKEEEKPGAGLGEPEAAPGDEDRGTDLAASGDAKSAGEASYNGSSDTIAKATAEANPARPPAPGDFGESVAESKGGEAEAEREGVKETSDVQSSATLSRRRLRRRGWRRKVVSGCSSGGDEPEADAMSTGGKGVAAESQPLINFLEFIRAHKYGSVFERRLESQKSVRYRSITRQHVDLEMVRAKLEGRRGGEAYTTSAGFFRDLLLLCNNAIVFYPKSSPESVAAVHLRGLVNKEMARTIRKPARRPKVEDPNRPALVSNIKSDPARASKLLEKPTSLVPLTACRKRSSLSVKAAAGSKEKIQVDRKEREVEEGETPAKKRSAASGSGGLRSKKTRRKFGVSKSPNSISTPTAKSTAAENLMEATAKSVKKNGGGEAVSASKKKEPADLPIRMKRSSLTSNGKPRITLRSSASKGGGGGKGAEQKKKGARGDGRKDSGSRQSPGAEAMKRAAVHSAPVKRSVGRPPKRPAAPLPSRVGRKRGRT